MQTNINEGNTVSEPKRLTNEQKFFYYLKNNLEKYEEIERKRALTYEETKEMNCIKEALWGKIVRYARSLAATSMQGYAVSSGYMDDIIQSIALIFFANLPKYDPLKSTPTTFFHRYFQEAITNYKLKDSQHLTQNDATNIRKVRTAIQDHEKKGEPYNYAVISQDTALSIKVVKKTIKLMNTSMRANIDDMLELQAKELTPEQQYLENERNRELYDVLDKELSDFEKEFLFAKINFNGDKDATYKDLSEKFGMAVHDVKSTWNDILTRLAGNPRLQRLNPTLSDDDLKLNTHTDASDIMEADILDEFKLDTTNN